MKGVAKGVYPINTGKVSIGSMYLPKRHQYTTGAELWTQNLLLRKPRKPTSVMRLRNVMRALRFWK